jgi:hypothetical protein
MSGIQSYAKLEEFGRIRLSTNFFARDFLHSEIAAWHRMQNVPDNPDVMVDVGRKLCVELLEPLQATFGRIHIRSGYRSPSVNEFGNEKGLNCAGNEANYAAHIWDYPDKDGKHGATACIVIPWLVDRIGQGGRWTEMAWWIHDHLPYSALYFFPTLSAFNIGWHEQPKQRIDSYAPPRGCLTRPDMANHMGSHHQEYLGYPELAVVSGGALAPAVRPRQTLSSVNAGSMKAVMPPQKPDEPDFEDSLATARANGRPVGLSQIRYRAVHTKTLWRKVNSHRSLEAAVNGKDGAAALFAGKARISYETHGTPLYVAIWQEGALQGFIVAKDPKGGIRKVVVPAEKLLAFEESGVARTQDLEQLF